MALKGYSAFPKYPALLEPHYQIVLRYIQENRWGSLTRQQRCSPNRQGKVLFGLVWFYGISTIACYLILNPLYIYMICKRKSIKLNSSKYCNVSLTNQLNISHLLTHSWFIKQIFFKQLNLACHLFTLSLNSCIWPIDWALSGATT